MISPWPGGWWQLVAGRQRQLTIGMLLDGAGWSLASPRQQLAPARRTLREKHSNKTFPLLPQCTAMGTRRALADTICAISIFLQMLRSFLFCICYLLCRYVPMIDIVSVSWWWWWEAPALCLSRNLPSLDIYAVLWCRSTLVCSIIQNGMFSLAR